MLIWGIAIGATILLMLVITLLDWSLGGGKARNARIKKLHMQMERWQKEGYDVSILEDLFK